jgi:hypothetical protein
MEGARHRQCSSALATVHRTGNSLERSNQRKTPKKNMYFMEGLALRVDSSRYKWTKSSDKLLFSKSQTKQPINEILTRVGKNCTIIFVQAIFH